MINKELRDGYEIHIGDPDKELLLVFSSYYNNSGMPQFEFVNFLDKIDGLNYVLFKDDQKLFYLNGIGGMSYDTDSTVIALRKLIDDIPHTKVRTLGMSAGAIAAIRIGALLNVDQIDAFSMLSYWSRKTLNSHGDHRTDPIIDYIEATMDKKDIKYTDIKYLEDIDFDSVFNIYYGSIDRLDKRQVDYMNSRHPVNVIKIDGAHHGNIVKMLRDNGGLTEILKPIT